MRIELYLPFPPTVNNYYVKTGRGQFISAKGRKYREEVNEALLEQVPDVLLDERLLVEVVLFPPDRRKRDVADNYGKALLDALTHDAKSDRIGIWEDDSLIDQCFYYRGVKSKPGYAFVRISEAGPVILTPDMLPVD